MPPPCLRMTITDIQSTAGGLPAPHSFPTQSGRHQRGRHFVSRTPRASRQSSRRQRILLPLADIEHPRTTDHAAGPALERRLASADSCHPPGEVLSKPLLGVPTGNAGYRPGELSEFPPEAGPMKGVDHGFCPWCRTWSRSSRQCDDRGRRCSVGRSPQWRRWRGAGNGGRDAERSEQWKPLDARGCAHVRRTRCGRAGGMADCARRWGRRTRGATVDPPAGAERDERWAALGADAIHHLDEPRSSATIGTDGFAVRPEADEEGCAQDGEVGTSSDEGGTSSGASQPHARLRLGVRDQAPEHRALTPLGNGSTSMDVTRVVRRCAGVGVQAATVGVHLAGAVGAASMHAASAGASAAVSSGIAVATLPVRVGADLILRFGFGRLRGRGGARTRRGDAQSAVLAGRRPRVGGSARAHRAIGSHRRHRRAQLRLARIRAWCQRNSTFR